MLLDHISEKVCNLVWTAHLAKIHIHNNNQKMNLNNKQFEGSAKVSWAPLRAFVTTAGY